jgi:DNA-directed RNA polymerase specialized sigma subunit
MKISLNMGLDVEQSKAAQNRAFEREILSAGTGDWNAKGNLVRHFTPLLTSLAQKRSQDIATINRCIDAGKDGLAEAARKYKQSIGPDRFQIFAVDFIEAAMDKAVREGSGKGSGFFARLFGK